MPRPVGGRQVPGGCRVCSGFSSDGGSRAPKALRVSLHPPWEPPRSSWTSSRPLVTSLPSGTRPMAPQRRAQPRSPEGWPRSWPVGHPVSPSAPHMELCGPQFPSLFTAGDSSPGLAGVQRELKGLFHICCKNRASVTQLPEPPSILHLFLYLLIFTREYSSH